MDRPFNRIHLKALSVQIQLGTYYYRSEFDTISQRDIYGKCYSLFIGLSMENLSVKGFL